MPEHDAKPDERAIPDGSHAKLFRERYHAEPFFSARAASQTVPRARTARNRSARRALCRSAQITPRCLHLRNRLCAERNPPRAQKPAPLEPRETRARPGGCPARTRAGYARAQRRRANHRTVELSRAARALPAGRRARRRQLRRPQTLRADATHLGGAQKND